MGDILSREEVDSLLKNEGEHKTDSKGRIVRPYDFHTPERFSKEHLRIFQILTEDFCHRMKKTLSGHLRLDMEVNIVSIRQTSFKDFITIKPPTYACIFTMSPLEGNAAMEIDPSFLIAVIEHLLGGETKDKPSRRDLTQIETDTASSIAQRILFCFREAFEKTLKFYPKIDYVESDPQFVVIASPNEAVLFITLEVKMKDISGTINICLPYLILESLIPHLNLKQWFMYSQKKVQNETDGKLNTHISSTKISLSCMLGNCEVLLRELYNLQEGDYLKLETIKDSEIVINVAGMPKFKAKIGLIGKRMAVKIASIIE